MPRESTCWFFTTASRVQARPLPCCCATLLPLCRLLPGGSAHRGPEREGEGGYWLPPALPPGLAHITPTVFLHPSSDEGAHFSLFQHPSCHPEHTFYASQAAPARAPASDLESKPPSRDSGELRPHLFAASGVLLLPFSLPISGQPIPYIKILPLKITGIRSVFLSRPGLAQSTRCFFTPFTAKGNFQIL